MVAFEPSIDVSSWCHPFPLTGRHLDTVRTLFMWRCFSGGDLQACYLRRKTKDIAKLYSCDSLLERMAQSFEDMVVISATRLSTRPRGALARSL